MPEQHRFNGIISPIVTLFDEAGEIDWKANERLADWLIARGIHGILYMGSTGEFSSLTKEERRLFAERMTAYINQRVKVLIGTGTTSLKDTIELSQHAQSIHADGVLVVNPFYWKYSEDQLFTYFSKVADEISIPMMLYNIPLLTGQSLSADLIRKLAAEKENIVGVKDTISDFGHLRKLIYTLKKERPEFAVFAAFDEHLLPGLELGAAGSVNATSIFAPEISIKLYESYAKGEYEEALKQHRKIAEIMPIYEYSNPLYLAIKEAVQQRVLRHETGFRIPASPVSGLKPKVKELLGAAGLD